MTTTQPCCVPGCFSDSIFAGLCNVHSTRSAEQQAKEMIRPQTPINATVSEFHDRRNSDTKMSDKYPKYYKAVPPGTDSIDIYALCKMFGVEDRSGAIHHAIKKLLLPGERTGGKSRRDDIKEARDTLTRWLEIHG